MRSEHGGKVIASSLSRETIEHCPKLGLNDLLGFVFAQNIPRSRLFEKSGFRAWGHLTRVAGLEGVKRDLVILGLRLDDKR